MAIFILAAGVKGTFGIGLPPVAISLLPLAVDPATAVTLLSLPIVATNFQQVVTFPGWPSLLRRFAPALTVLFTTTFAVSYFLHDLPSEIITFVAGITLVIFAVSALFNIELPADEGPAWQIGVGLASGIFGGLAAVMIPNVIYGAALRLPKDEFIAVTGILFLTGGIGLLAGFTASTALSAETLPLAITALLAAVAGFQAGAWLRVYIDPDTFRRLVLYVLLLSGLRLLVVSLA